MEQEASEIGYVRYGGYSDWQREAAKKEIARRRHYGQFVSVREFCLLMELPYIHEEWQLKQIEAVISACSYKIPEVILIRARGGSKTHDIMIVCLYLAYLGYDGIFFAAEGSQIDKPKDYMRELIDGSFLSYCIDKDHYLKLSVRFKGGGSLMIRNLTEKKARSPRADFIVYDEEAVADNDAIKAASGIFGGTKMGLTIHCSTPVKGSIFEDNYNKLLRRQDKTGNKLVLIRKWNEIGFLACKAERYKDLQDSMPDFYFRQEHECSFENPAGSIFTKVLYDKEEIERFVKENEKEKILYSGIDWNPKAGHWLVAGYWTRNKMGFVVTECFNIEAGYTHELNELTYRNIRPYFLRGNRLCVECSGINDAYVNWLRKNLMYDGAEGSRGLFYEEWDSAGKNKMNCVINIRTKMLCIDKSKFPELAKEVSEAHFDENSYIPKMYKSKTNSPHRLDSLLHATSPLLQNVRTPISYTRWR